MALWGKTDATPSIPTWLNSAEAAKAVFVDATEAQVQANKDRGITGGGWWLVETYTDVHGKTRHKAECLVTLQETQANAGDRADDALVADVLATITIGTQPTAQTTVSGAATFTVVASNDQAGALSYQWQVKAAGEANWTDVSGATGSAIVLTVQTADNDGDEYRVKVNSADGAAEVVSDAAVLTFGD